MRNWSRSRVVGVEKIEALNNRIRPSKDPSPKDDQIFKIKDKNVKELDTY